MIEAIAAMFQLCVELPVMIAQWFDRRSIRRAAKMESMNVKTEKPKWTVDGVLDEQQED